MPKEVYNPKAVIPHAASLHQACAHCAISPTAASRRSLGRISVPVWPTTLSGRLPVDALVGRHPTNKLIGREPIPRRKTSFPAQPCDQTGTSGIRPRFQSLSRSRGAGCPRITHPFATNPHHHKDSASSFDLHVLSTPPAFVLSQDQTLHKKQNIADSPKQAHQNPTPNRPDTPPNPQKDPTTQSSSTRTIKQSTTTPTPRTHTPTGTRTRKKHNHRTHTTKPGSRQQHYTPTPHPHNPHPRDPHHTNPNPSHTHQQAHGVACSQACATRRLCRPRRRHRS